MSSVGARVAAGCLAALPLVALSGSGGATEVSAQGVQPSYVFTDLGLPVGTIAIGAYAGSADINNNGVIVGSWAWPSRFGAPGDWPDNLIHGFKWKQGTLTEVIIPTAILAQEPFVTGCRPDNPATQTASCRIVDLFPRAIDDIGRIAGSFTVRKTQCEAGKCNSDVGWNRGFVMPDGGNATIVGCPPGSGCDWGYADVWGINIAGVVTGDYTTGGTTAAYRTHGFRGVTVLDYPGTVRTHVRGINGAFDMDVVGFYYPDRNSGATRGFLFNLGTFSPIDVAGSWLTMPSAINDAGDIVGTYSDTAGGWAGFVWPDAPGGTASRITDGVSQMQQALGNNEAGQIVGIVVSASSQRFVLATLQKAVVPTMSIDRTSLAFAAVNSGAAFTFQTSTQTVRLRQTGAGSVSWTAASTTPWLTVSPTSGSGSTTLAISTRFASGISASQTGSINLTFTGAGNTVGPLTVTLRVVSSAAAASVPFGVFDTPAGDGTVLAGSIAVTGWTLDNIGVQRVELWRDLQPGETTPPFASTPADPRNGKAFIANTTFVDNARPDVEALHPSMPFAYRAGWGYLLLTRGLWNQGNGTYKLHAFAFDQENNLGTIGTKTVVVNNTAATKPFGSIDTPAIGGDASGPNFGWALTPTVNGVATCKIQASGVQVSIDSGPLQPVVYGDARTDIAGAFPGFSNTAAAGGHYLFDWSTLTNGPHTIVWVITDDCNRADGVGSRFFNVTTGSNLLARNSASSVVAGATGAPLASAMVASPTESSDPITVTRGYGELPEIVDPAITGSRTVEMKQGERIEIRVPRGFESVYQLVPGGQRRALPIGSTWDAGSETFYWQPAPGFLGRFRLVFSNGSQRISVRVIVTP